MAAVASVVFGPGGMPPLDGPAVLSPAAASQLGSPSPAPVTEPRPELWSKLLPEIVDLVIEALASSSRQELVKLCRLSKAHYAQLNPRVYRKIEIEREQTVHRLLRTFRSHLYAAEALPRTDIINIGACHNLVELLSAFVAHRYQPLEMRLCQSNRYHGGPDVKISEFRSLRRLLVQESRGNEPTNPMWLDQHRQADEVRCIQLPILETFLSVAPWGRICRDLGSIHFVMPKLQNLYLVPDVRLLHFGGRIAMSSAGQPANIPEMLERYAHQTLTKINQLPHIKRLGILVGDSWSEPSGLSEDDFETRLKVAMDKVNKDLRELAILHGHDDFTFLFAYLSRGHVQQLRFKRHPFALVAMEKVLEAAFAAREAGSEDLFSTRSLADPFDNVDEDVSPPRHSTQWVFGGTPSEFMGPEYGQKGIDKANGVAVPQPIDDDHDVSDESDEDEDADDDDEDDEEIDEDDQDAEDYDEEGDSQMEDADGADSEDAGSEGTVAASGDTAAPSGA